MTAAIGPSDGVGGAASQPVVRLYGDYGVQYNGATFLLKDVYFDAPDLGAQPSLVIEENPINPG